MAAPKKVDYERIEPGWRVGILSPAQLASEYTMATGISVSHTAIIKHFTKRGVPRDLSAKVQAKADSMVMDAMVTGKVSSVTLAKESEIVAESATQQATIRIGHRKDIVRFRNVAIDLLAELESQTGNADLFQELGEFLRSEDDKGQDKRNDVYQKVISSVGRIDGLKKLAEVLKILVGLEREAYGIADAGKEGEPKGVLNIVMNLA